VLNIYIIKPYINWLDYTANITGAVRGQSIF
jgi:hypothetical protein